MTPAFINRGWRKSLAALTAALLAACYPELDWREVVLSEGNCAVLLPGKPTRDARDVVLAGGVTRMEMSSVQISGMAFGVAHAELPAGANPARALEGGRDALVRNINGRITAERPIEVSGARGVEFEADGTAQDARVQLAARVLVAGARYYQVAFVGREERAGAVDTALFLRSFRLLTP